MGLCDLGRGRDGKNVSRLEGKGIKEKMSMITRLTYIKGDVSSQQSRISPPQKCDIEKVERLPCQPPTNP